MSLTVWLGFRDKFTCFVVSFIEAVVFFTLVSALYFVLVAAAYVWFAWAWGSLRLASPWDVEAWLKVLPTWMWLIEAGGYLLLVTIYWAPGDEAVNNAQVWAFAAFLLVAAMAGAVWQHRLLGRALKTVWEAWRGG